MDRMRRRNLSPRAALVGGLSLLLAAVWVPGAQAVPAPAAAAPVPAAAGAPAALVPTSVASGAVGAVAGSFAAAAVRASTVTLKVSDTRPRRGERIFVKAWVSDSRGPVAKARVVVEQRVGTRWKRVGTYRTSATGRISTELRVVRLHRLRARVLDEGGTVRGSATRKVVSVARTRTLGARAAEVGTARLGRATGDVVTLTAKQRRATKVAKVVKVRSRDYKKATLVEVSRRRGSKIERRTWFVNGSIGKAYRKAGGAKGSWGVPTADARCGLLEKGCVQTFTRRTAYVSRSSDGVVTARATGARGAIVAAARSQVGYVRAAPNPSVQSTKFNTWMGTGRAWCSFFQSWASVASGNGKAVPKIDRFVTFRETVRSTMRTGRTPKVGALAFRHTTGPAGEATHVALVSEVDGDRVRLIDGNTVGPLPAGHRGVLERWFPRSAVLYYAYPEY